MYRYARTVVALLCLCLLLLACQSARGSELPEGRADQQAAIGSTPPGFLPTVQPPSATATPGVTATPTHKPTPTPTAIPTAAPTVGLPPTPVQVHSNGPVLAFYYSWYTTSTWCSCHMSDLPTIEYNSSDPATINRQLTWAMDAGITGFISSWWGPGDQTDTNFAKVLAQTGPLVQKTGHPFASTIYFESDSPNLAGQSAIVSGLQYVLSHYSNNPHFFHWQGKPVLFFWDPLGGGRTLAEWAAIRSQVDPNDRTIWSAEGVDMSLLSVFDGIHLFSGGYWGLQNGDMAAVDQGFRAKIDAYNQANQTQKIWAAGVIPGYNDTLIPGRTGTYIVPRNNGATYMESWNGAMASNPDWITITSFNEWFEGSMIEPSVTYGNLYLNLTQQFTQEWHG
jgi:hypothetical protein